MELHIFICKRSQIAQALRASLSRIALQVSIVDFMVAQALRAYTTPAQQTIGVRFRLVQTMTTLPPLTSITTLKPSLPKAETIGTLLTVKYLVGK